LVPPESCVEGDAVGFAAQLAQRDFFRV
jgi:hypothetical protein